MTDTTRDELIAMRARLDELIGDDPTAAAPVAMPEPKRTPDAYIMVDGKQMPAAMQPPQSELQGAFTVGGTKNKPRIVIDMAKARLIAQDMVRQARVEAFAKNDAARAIAIDDEDDVARAAVRRKARALKDAPADKRLTDAKNETELLAAVDAIIAEF